MDDSSSDTSSDGGAPIQSPPRPRPFQVVNPIEVGNSSNASSGNLTNIYTAPQIVYLPEPPSEGIWIIPRITGRNIKHKNDQILTKEDLRGNSILFPGRKCVKLDDELFVREDLPDNICAFAKLEDANRAAFHYVASILRPAPVADIDESRTQMRAWKIAVGYLEAIMESKKGQDGKPRDALWLGGIPIRDAFCPWMWGEFGLIGVGISDYHDLRYNW